MDIRNELERLVYSTNVVLRDSVKDMSYVILLRNLHPIYRANYAMLLYNNRLITKDEAHEFAKFVG